MTLEDFKADRDGWEKKLSLAREAIKTAQAHERRTLVSYLRAEQAYTEAYIRTTVKDNEGNDGL